MITEHGQRGTGSAIEAYQNTDNQNRKAKFAEDLDLVNFGPFFFEESVLIGAKWLFFSS